MVDGEERISPGAGLQAFFPDRCKKIEVASKSLVARDHDYRGRNISRTFGVGAGLNLGFALLGTGFGSWANSPACRPTPGATRAM
jgi:hypothetical protein